MLSLIRRLTDKLLLYVSFQSPWENTALWLHRDYASVWTKAILFAVPNEIVIGFYYAAVNKTAIYDFKEVIENINFQFQKFNFINTLCVLRTQTFCHPQDFNYLFNARMFNWPRPQSNSLLYHGVFKRPICFDNSVLYFVPTKKILYKYHQVVKPQFFLNERRNSIIQYPGSKRTW